MNMRHMTTSLFDAECLFDNTIGGRLEVKSYCKANRSWYVAIVRNTQGQIITRAQAGSWSGAIVQCIERVEAINAMPHATKVPA